MTLVEMVIKEYEDLKVNFQPLYPAILVRVLPKEHMQGGLWLPDTKQNKPVYEGIVLRVYPPKRIQLDNGKWITMDSGLEIGQHILFPHWSGEQVPWLRDALKSTTADKEEYRIIPARALLSLAGMRDSGEPYLVVNRILESVDDKLDAILHNVYNDGYRDGIHTKMVGYDLIKKIRENIKKEFDILVKVEASVTTSGE